MKTELSVLIRLLEDPDPEIYLKMTEKILAHGNNAIPELEKASFSAKSNDHFDRINRLLSQLDFERLEKRIDLWKNSKAGSMLEGINLITEITEGNAPFEEITQRIHAIKNKIWLEFSDKLTALEKIRVINHFLFTIYGYTIKTDGSEHPLNYSLHKLLTDKAGAPDSIYLLYEIICRMLDLPVFGIYAVGLNYLAYLDIPYIIQGDFDPSKEKVLFFIDPVNYGRPMGKNNLQRFMFRQLASVGDKMLIPISDRRFVRNYAEHLYEKCIIADKNEPADKLETIIKSWKPSY